MDPALFDHLQQTLTSGGPAAAIDRLCADLRERKEYGSLFYALLLKKRVELGVSPVPTGASADIPAQFHEVYEQAIRDAGREVGQLYLDEGNIPQAWLYFRMLGEPGPVAAALEQVRPAEGEDCQPLVEIAFYHGVNPRRGFELMLERFGLCNSITTLGNRELPLPEADRIYCIKRLIHTLYSELRERLKAEIVRREGSAPATESVAELMQGRDWLFADEWYHVDVSHLGAVVQMSVSLPPGDADLLQARELCQYGQKLSPRFQYPGDPPFDDQYRDTDRYLAILAGDDVEANLDHFRAKVLSADPAEGGTLAAEALVNLLLRVDRTADALAIARTHLAEVDDRRLSCPSIPDLCQRTGDFRTLAEVARQRQDPVHFLAGLLAAGSK